ncbi:MAG: UDP-N-acetylglucosamine 1-carboxyvinyltransferase [Clostridia bacterium]|nr:UDP-N-acetylglucosamine 1-carboxyvinyltransferase [Clostridia bacterium]
MDKLVIQGGNKLYGSVTIGGAKNAVVALLPATLLARDVVVLENVPAIRDVRIMLGIMGQLGAQIKMLDRTTYQIDTRNIEYQVVPNDVAKRLRASYYLIGAMLGTFGKADVSLPGGCDFGVRPINLHLKGFKSLGANVDVANGMVKATTENGLTGSSIYMDEVSVGATINVMLAAVKAHGLTIIENAAREPHIVDLANFLNRMGANVRGAGTDVIKIKGVESLHGCQYSVIPDQIEAGTYMTAVAAAGGDVVIKNVTPKHLESIIAKLEECGVDIEEGDDEVRVRREGALTHCNVKTMPHPGFPTDMQPQIVALLSLAQGTSIVNESVWESRFRYVNQLIKFGAKINVEGSKMAVIQGVDSIKGACVNATDLRGGAAMIIAGLAAEGETEIEDIYHIERGYEDVVEKFRAIGADIQKRYYPDDDELELRA